MQLDEEVGKLASGTPVMICERNPTPQSVHPFAVLFVTPPVFRETALLP